MRRALLISLMLLSCRLWSLPCEDELTVPSKPYGEEIESVHLPSQWIRVPISVVEKNPYTLGSSLEPQVITLNGEDLVLAIGFGQIPYLRNLIQSADPVAETWLSRVNENVEHANRTPEKATALARLWNDPKLIMDVALNSFFEVFDERLRDQTVQQGRRVALIALQPTLNQTVIFPSLPPRRAPRPKAKPMEVQLMRRPEVSRATVIFQRYSRQNVLTMVEQMVFDPALTRIFDNKSFRPFVDRLIDTYPVPLSSVKAPEKTFQVYTSRQLTPESQRYLFQFYLHELYRYRDEANVDHIVVDRIERLSRQDYLEFVAGEIEKDLGNGTVVSGIFVPDGLTYFSYWRLTDDFIREAIDRLSDEERARLNSLKNGQRVFLKQQYSRVFRVRKKPDVPTGQRVEFYSVWFHIKKTPKGLVLLSMW